MNMSSWIIGAVAALIAIVFGVGWFFMTLVILNGYSGREAQPMIVTSAILSLINVVVSAGLSPWLAGLAQRKAEVTPWVVGPIAVIAVTIVGAVIVMVGSFVGIAVFSNR